MTTMLPSDYQLIQSKSFDDIPGPPTVPFIGSLLHYLPFSNYHVTYDIGLEEFEGVIRIYISKKNRQHNGQKKKYKRTNNDLQNIHTKLKIE